MITIIHGDDTSKSRNYYLELRQKQKDFLSFDGGKITITDLVQNIEGSGLFGNSKTIFLEDFLTKSKKADKSAKEILTFIIKNSQNSNFIFWESREISKGNLFIFKNAVVKIFKLPKNIFLFLDNLKPNNSKNLLKLFHQALDSDIAPEMIIFMLQRQFRILLALSEPSEKDQIEEVSRLTSWQMEKFNSQAKLFNKEKLIKIYQKLFEIELGQKTGMLPLSLSQAIDFLLIDM
jgi:DNA polymerase III delta subunit